MTKVEKIIFIVLIAVLALTVLFWNDVRRLLGASPPATSEEHGKKDKKDKDDKKDKKKKKDKDDKDDNDDKKSSTLFDLNERPDMAYFRPCLYTNMPA